jgi:hypothetical protein
MGHSILACAVKDASGQGGVRLCEAVKIATLSGAQEGCECKYLTQKWTASTLPLAPNTLLALMYKYSTASRFDRYFLLNLFHQLRSSPLPRSSRPHFDLAPTSPLNLPFAALDLPLSDRQRQRPTETLASKSPLFSNPKSLRNMSTSPHHWDHNLLSTRKT